MAGSSASYCASFDGDGDAVTFDDNNDDFQLPDNFDNEGRYSLARAQLMAQLGAHLIS